MPREDDRGDTRSEPISIEELCESTWKELYRYIYYKVQNREEAEDITQETYSKALDYLNRSEGKVLEYKSYLRTIALNIIRDHWRSNKRRKSIDIEAVNPEEMAVEDFSNLSDDRTLIKRAMNKLSREQQLVIEYRIIQGYSAAETARLMNKKEGTIRVIQYRAIKALSQLLKDPGGSIKN